MRKLLLAAVAGTAFALAGCSEKAPEAPATEAVESTDAAADASAAPSEDASAPAADASSEAPKM
jgi:PBP1b-binding outer membrane lipoprotein LpoB